MGSTLYKLPVFNTIWLAVKLPFTYPSVFVRAASFYFLARIITFIFVPYLVVSGMPDMLRLPAMTMVLASVAHFAVAWHRFIILGARQPAIVRFGRYEAFYLILLLIVGPGVSFLAQAIGTLPEDIAPAGQILAVFVVIGFMAPLFGIIAPSVAIGKYTLSIGHYWKLMTNNRLRFIGVLLITEFILAAGYWACVKLASFLTWDVVVPVLNIEVPNPADPDLFSLVVISMPSSVFLGVASAYAVSVGIGVLSISYYRFAAVR